MAVTFTGDDAQAKLARAKADIEVIRGPFGDPNITLDEIGQAIDEKLTQLKLPHSNEKDTLDSLHKAALNELLSEKNLADTGKMQRVLFYMGYTDTWDASGLPPDQRIASASKAIDNFLSNHPEYKNLAVKDLYNKITDSQWSEQPKQPQAEKNRTDLGGPMYTGGGEFGGGYNQGIYADYDDEASKDVRQTAEATFGKDNISLIQAQLYMRDPAHNHRPDGAWNMQDQQELLKFISDENAKGHAANPIPSPVAMRWQGTPEQADFTARVTTALTNSSITPALQSVQNTQHKDILAQPTQADGASNANDIQKMQLYLKLAGCYNGNTTPTGIWTVQDQTAMQKYLDNPDHKRNWFTGIFASNPLPDRVQGLSGADFHKILDYAANEAKDKNGITPDLANRLCTDITKPATEPLPIKPIVPTTPPATKTTPPPAEATPPTAGSDPNVPHTVTANANTQKGGPIANYDEAKMQAQLNLMGYYNGQINGTATDTDAALKDYAAKRKPVDSQGKLIDANDRVKLQAAIQKDWDAFARANAPALQQQVDAGHAVPASHDKKDENDAVKQMQVALLAAGGHLPKYGVDGLRWTETNAAYGEVTDANHQLIVKPAADPDPAGTPTPPAVAAERPPYINDDPIGPGGFITPPDHYNAAPAPQPVSAVTPAPTSTPAAGDPDFTRTGNPQGGVRSPVVTGNDVGSGRSSGMSDYYNGQSRADHGTASSFFQRISTPYITELGSNRGWPLEMLPNAKDSGIPKYMSGTFKHDQGQAFLTGPDGRFAAQYAMNGGQLTYVTTYDLDDPAQNQAFQSAKVQAERQNAKGQGAAPIPVVYAPGYDPGPYSQGGGVRLNLNLGRSEGPRGGPWRR